MDLLLDTNVFIDFLSRREPFYRDAVKVFAAGGFGDVRLWMPVQSIADAFYVLRKHIAPDRLQKMIIRACSIISPVDIIGQDALRALRLSWADYEDCLISVAAEKVKADYLITRDRDGFARSSVPVASPEEILNLLWEQQNLRYDEVVF